MATIIELLKLSENFLRAKGVKTPRLDAELLFAFVLRCKRLDLYLMYNREITDPALSSIRNAICRRGAREPVQHITGEVSFYNVLLNVNRDVLIPRHETEELVDIIVNKFCNKIPKTVLDLGTGSGAIALSLAKRFRNSAVTAVDISDRALSVARENARRNFISNVEFARSDWFDNISGKFDIIVSNPPYLSEHDIESADPEVKNFDPTIALVSDQDGLGDIFKIISHAGRFLTSDGILAIETGPSQHDRIRGFSTKYFKKFSSMKDLAGRDRFVIISESIS